MSSQQLTTLRAYWDGKAAEEPAREQSDVVKIVHTDLLRRMIARHIPGPSSAILDAGAGIGRFSIPLARQGHRVTHLDLSDTMLTIARERASNLGAGNIEFAQGTITEMPLFADRAFDLVICLDSPISFCHRHHEKALDELTRVARTAVVFSVMSRTSLIMAGGVDFDLTHYGRLRTVKDVYDTGDLQVDDGLLQLHANLMPSWHAFTPDELRQKTGARGFQATELSAIGTLSSLAKKELLLKLIESKEYQEYLDFEEMFDGDKSLLGNGFTGAGSLAIAARRI